MDKDKDDSKTSSILNFLRLHYLLTTTASTFLRQHFSQLWESYCNLKWENNQNSGQQFFGGIGKSLYEKSQRIQKRQLQLGNTSTWDLPLLISALSVVNGSIVDFPSDRNLRRLPPTKLEKLKEVRNKIAHLGTVELDDATFESHWTLVASILLDFGVPATEINTAKKLTLAETDAVPPPQTSPNHQLYEELKTQGNKCFSDKQYGKSIDVYSRAIALEEIPSTDLAVLYANRSVANLKLGNFPDAKDDARSAITLRPTWFRGYSRLANVYSELGEHHKSLKNNEIALSLNPSSVEILDARDYCIHMIAKLKREEHLDPLLQVCSKEDINNRLRLLGYKVLPGTDNCQKVNFMMGLPVGICGEAHKYYHGMEGYKQDYEMAAKLFSNAAQKGNAEGLYNIGVMTRDGKGVKRDILSGYRFLLQAASLEPITEVAPGSGVMERNLGVAEAQHALGLACHEGVGMERNFDKAATWYKKALDNGSGFSANNLALMYQDGQGVERDMEKAILYWKGGSFLGTVRAMENIALLYANSAKFPFQKHKLLPLAQQWYLYAVHHGSISLPLRKNEFMIHDLKPKEFDPDKFKEGLKEELLHSSLKHLAIPNDIELKQNEILNLFPNGPFDVDPLRDDFREKIIIQHRVQIGHHKKEGKHYKFEGNPGKIVPKAMVDLVGLKSISLKDLDLNIDDKVYEGYILKVTVIEDPLLRTPSHCLLVQDDNADVQRVFVYNYPEGNTTHQEIGYGCRFSIVNPYFRKMRDGQYAIRIDDANLIFRHPQMTDTKRCRFCGKGGEGNSTIQCRKCRRVHYCSKLCLKKDEEKLQHKLVCFKRL